MLEDNKKRAFKIRPHSNTISGGRPPNLDISKCRPAFLRRNSEGSPSFPPPIRVSESTPVEPVSDAILKAENSNDKINLLKPSTDKPKSSRLRASSVESNKSDDNSLTIQKSASKIKSRSSLEDSEYTDNISSVAVSLAGTSGVYLANGKRNQDFHALFKSVPEEDGLLEDYGCALQKEILLQGRIYISENHVCFNANIFGWVTNLVIAFADITSIEKRSTAYFIPNAIQISTDNAKHFFASFLSRDITYDLMVDIWRLARPDLAPPKLASRQKNLESESTVSSCEESDSCYDSDTEDSFSDNNVSEDLNSKKLADSEIKTKKPPVIKRLDPNRRRAASEAIRPVFRSKEGNKSSTHIDNGSSLKSKTSASKSPPAKGDAETKPQLNEKTECDCGAHGEHYSNVVFDQTYNGTMDKFYDLLFKSEFMPKFLTENQKTTELEMGDWRKGDGKVELVRDYSYIKPLNGAIGPRSTKCYIKEEIYSQDTQQYVSALATTSTPDVPAGGSFSCKTRTCLTWAGKGRVRMLVTVLVDFTKSSWLKSTIEKASIDGQQTFYKDLDAAFQAYFRQHPEDFGGSKKDVKRKRKDTASNPEKQPTVEERKPDNKPTSAVHQILGSFSNRLADMIVSIINIFSSPQATHLTLICLIGMACVNVLIAQRMSSVEQQILELGRIIPRQAMEQEEIIHIKPNTNQNDGSKERDVWEWLHRLDPEKPVKEVTKEIKIVKGQEVVWNDAIKLTKQAKDRLDRHMIELSGMIQKAENSLEDITSAVLEQRQKIKNDKSPI